MMRIMLCEAILFPFDAFAGLNEWMNRIKTNSTDQLQFYKLPVMGNEERRKKNGFLHHFYYYAWRIRLKFRRESRLIDSFDSDILILDDDTHHAHYFSTTKNQSQKEKRKKNYTPNSRASTDNDW